MVNSLCRGERKPQNVSVFVGVIKPTARKGTQAKREHFQSVEKY
jgi:hypothetical protein